MVHATYSGRLMGFVNYYLACLAWIKHSEEGVPLQSLPVSSQYKAVRIVWCQSSRLRPRFVDSASVDHRCRLFSPSCVYACARQLLRYWSWSSLHPSVSHSSLRSASIRFIQLLRSLAFCEPAAWNSLSPASRDNSLSSNTFKQKQKTSFRSTTNIIRRRCDVSMT